MTDIATNRPLRVSTDGTAGPYLMVPLSQLAEIRRLLDQNQIGYWVDEHAISWNEEPYIACINLGRDGDAAKVQSILDQAA
jgi:hypothetical protein